MLPGKSTALALLAVIAMMAAACAQSPGGPGGTRGGMSGKRDGATPDAMRGGSAANAPLNPGALVLVQLDQLEDDLKLAPAQRGAWTAYAGKVQKLADQTTRARFEARTSAPEQSSAVQQLDLIATGMRSRSATVEEIVDLGRLFYATLTPEQKPLADSRLSLTVSLLATGVAPAGLIDAGGRSERRRGP